MLNKPVSLLLFVLLLSTKASALELTSYAFVNDDATLRVEKKTIHLYGIYIPSSEQSCRTRQHPPVCGSRAALALEFKVKRFVRCEIVAENPDDSFTGLCYVNYSHFEEGEDLSAYLLERGWAVALPDAPVAYHAMEKIARSRGVGIWGISVDRPYINPY